MDTFLIIVAVSGAILSFWNLYIGARYVVSQWGYRGEAKVMPDTVWQLNTVPLLSTILLFTMRHWMFAIPIFLLIAHTFGCQLRSKHRDGAQPFLVVLAGASGLIGRICIVLGTAAILTLPSGRAGFESVQPWVAFVLFSVAFFFVSSAANAIVAWLIGVIASVVGRK